MILLPAMEAQRLRAAWSAMDRPALVTRPLLAPTDAAQMRAFFDELDPQERDDEGGHRLAELHEHESPGIVRRCCSIAESIAGGPLSIEGVRLQRVRPGGFQIPIDGLAPDARRIEVALDFSERPADSGELVYYAAERPTFTVTPQPGVLSLVECRPETTRGVNTLAGESPIYRLLVTLGVSSPE